VALPRTKLVLAIAPARLEAPARRAERAAWDVRKRVVDMTGLLLIGIVLRQL
jgi:hypothetical protein